ncbi:MAG: S8/S53 family peptidase [Gemmatimonadetes bacterium]|nr:S8/S53 family peptidase [Gemmatimonadota bacterium]MCC6771951.1 S8/S53 family peptidase [Gemmatimonadaceae bacterium]
MKNLGTVAMVAPARIRFNADSSQFLNGQGQVIAGTPNILAVNYDTANASGRSGQWRFDTLLAASGSVQVLAPNGTTRRRWLEFTGTSWSQTVRIKLPTVGTQVGSVPAVAPDTLPQGFSSYQNLTQDADGGAQYVRNHISVYFLTATAQSLRQVAIASVNGLVVGGVRLANGDGFYVVRLPADTSAATIDAAIATLSQRAEVRLASRYYTLPVRPSFLRPNDGQGFARSDWNVSSAFAWTSSQPRTRWALEGVRAPLAWGCSIGDSLTRVAVLDQGFFTSSISDLANVVAAPIVNIAADPEDHGTSVASIIGARGGNNTGMTGVAWRAALELRDVTYRDSLLQPVLDSLGRRRNKDGLPFLQDVQAALLGGARLINLSIGANNDTLWRRDTRGLQAAATLNAQMSIAIETALSAPNLADPLLIISSGNVPAGDGFESIFPTLKDSLGSRVLVVAAVKRDGTLLTARSGSALIDVAAPGEDVALLKRGGNTPQYDNGASFATPIVTGIATLLLSFDPRLSADALRQLIIDGAVRGGRQAGGYPIVDAYESLKLAAQRPGAPLCGNRVFIRGDSVFAQRDPANNSSDELLGLFPLSWPMLAVEHGGRAITNHWYAGTGLNTLTFSPTGWTLENRTPRFPDSGFARSGETSSHDADTLLTFSWAGTSALSVALADSLGAPISQHLTASLGATAFGGRAGYDPSRPRAVLTLWNAALSRVFLLDWSTASVTQLPTQFANREVDFVGVAEDGSEFRALTRDFGVGVGSCHIEFVSLRASDLGAVRRSITVPKRSNGYCMSDGAIAPRAASTPPMSR